MPSAVDRIEFAPPAQPGMLRAMALAVLAHLLLVAALTWGVSWKRQNPTVTTAEAELWASVPQQAAPRAAEPPPAPPPPPPEPKPEPQPAPKPAPEPAPVEKAPDIVNKVDKPPKKVVQEKPVEKPEAKTPPPKPQAKPEPKPEPKPDPAAAKREAQREAQRKAAQEAAEDEKQLAAQREENIKRMAGMAGASGGPTATGAAQQSSGPSSGYGGRVKAKVKPNLVFTSTVSGNPIVSIEVRAAPDGTILGVPRVVKSSGNREWDDAVVRAFVKTEVMPRDTNGSVPSPIIVDWRVND